MRRIALAVGALAGAVAACGESVSPVAACGEGLTFGRREGASGTADWVAIDASVSREMLAGRSMTLDAALYTYSQYWAAQQAPLEWCSSNPSVLAIEDDEAVAEGPGEATLYAWTAEKLADSVTVTVLSAASGFDVVFLGDDVGAGSIGIALNDDGAIVGTAGSARFLWRDHVVTDLAGCVPVDINASGQVACTNGIWSNGAMQPVTFAGVTRVRVDAINDLGHVAGSATGGTSTCNSCLFRWRSETSVDTYAAYSGDRVGAINDAGIIVGTSYPGGYWHPIVIENGTVRALSGSRYGEAEDVSGSGDIVGGIELLSGTNLHVPIRWRAANNWTGEPLPPMATATFPGSQRPAGLRGTATAINAAGDIVGTLEPPTSLGVLWRDARLVRLSSLVDANWEVTAAIDINASGQILAGGRNVASGASGAVMLTPR